MGLKMVLGVIGVEVATRPRVNRQAEAYSRQSSWHLFITRSQYRVNSPGFWLKNCTQGIDRFKLPLNERQVIVNSISSVGRVSYVE